MQPCARAASAPAILRTDAFVAMRYDASTALVFFNSAALPANPGLPAGAWPQDASKWLGPHARLQLVRTGGEKQWINRWPGGADFAPHMGAEFVLALGGGAQARGMLSSIGYLPLCDTTWLVGLVRVDASQRALYGSAGAEGFVAYAATAAATSGAQAGATIGPVLRSGDADAFDASARAKIETALQGRVTGDYANYLKQRESIYEGGQSSTLAHVRGDDAMIAGHAQLSYTAQKVTVGPATPRYYVRALWKASDSSKDGGEAVYTISAWFTTDWELESVSESDAPLGGATDENGRIVNLFPLAALPMLDQGDDTSDHNNILLMEERGPEGVQYSLERWTPGGLLPTGIYFADHCK